MASEVGLEMEKYLVREPVGEGDLSEQWTRFKEEFGQFKQQLENGMLCLP